MAEEKIPPEPTLKPQLVVEPVSEPEISKIPPKQVGSRLKIILLSILGLIFISGLVFTGYKIGQKRNQPGTQPTPTPIVAATPTPDPTANWKTYRNEEYGFEIKYPSEFIFSSEGPNSAQQIMDRGERVSGTVQPSYDTIIFSDSNNELGRIEIFHKYAEDIIKDNYKDKGYLYLFGPCDVRLGFQPEVFSLNSVNNVNILTVKGKNQEDVSQNCNYLKNSDGNLIVLSNKNYKSEIFNQILSTFKFLDQNKIKVKLFYYNEKFDPQFDCLDEAVLPVEREIARTETPIEDTIKLLIEGKLTSEEMKNGFSTEFPEPGFKLLSANLKNGTLTLDFPEIPSFTTGGSCRIGLLTAQIKKTAKQFSEVKEVRFANPELFQP